VFYLGVMVVVRLFFEAGSWYVASAGLKLAVLLHSHKCWVTYVCCHAQLKYESFLNVKWTSWTSNFFLLLKLCDSVLSTRSVERIFKVFYLHDGFQNLHNLCMFISHQLVIQTFFILGFYLSTIRIWSSAEGVTHSVEHLVGIHEGPGFNPQYHKKKKIGFDFRKE
jgi:hypothetical protein